MKNKLLPKFFQEILLWGFAIVAAIYLVINIFPGLQTFAAATILGDGVLIYSTSTSAGLVHYRTYSTSTNAFSDPVTAVTVPADTIRYIKAASSPTSTEKIVVVQDDMGATGVRFTVMRWQGSSWTTDWEADSTASSTVGIYKHFGVAYYGNSGNAMVVYATSTSPALAFRTWNGTSWSATSTFGLATGAGATEFIYIAAPPTATSNQRLALAYSDGTSQIGFAIWNGSTWGVASTTGVISHSAKNVWRNFDIAIENTSGDAYVAFIKQGQVRLRSVSCVSGCSSWTANPDTNTGVTQGNFVAAAASPQIGSNRIAIAYCGDTGTANDDIFGQIWTGTSTATNAAVDSSGGCDALTQTNVNFPIGIGWLGTSDIAFFVYPNNAAPGAGVLDYAIATAGSNTFSGSQASSGLDCIVATFKTSVSVDTWPNSNQAMVTTTDSNSKICESIKNSGSGTAWTSSGFEMGNTKSAGGLAVDFSFNNVVSPTLGQRDFRWYVNSSTSTTPNGPWPTGGPYLAENASITSSDSPPATNDIVRLRVSATSTNATIAAGTSYKLQFQATASTDCTSGSWTDVGAATTWALVDNAGVADGATITRSLTASTVNENYNESVPSSGMPNPISIGQVGEFDWAFKNNGAAGGTTYRFRMTEADGTAFSAYTNCPGITTAAAAGPTTDQVLRHGTWFNAGIKQSFFWAQ